MDDVTTFEALRSDLTALAYRMLGDVGRAEDAVQEAWLRWQRRPDDVASPRAFLITIVTRLCLNELQSARARREQSRGDRLPEPVDLEETGMARLENLEQVSMAFVVVLQRLTPIERAVLLLHDVFDFEHREIATLLARTPVATRKLLERARRQVASGRRFIGASSDEHARLLRAFARAAGAGDVAGLAKLLAADAVLVADAGPGGRVVAGIRNLPGPLEGATRIAAFVAAISPRLALAVEERVLNGQPALLFRQDGRPFAALLLAVADGKIQRVFFQADPERLRHASTVTEGSARAAAPPPARSPSRR